MTTTLSRFQSVFQTQGYAWHPSLNLIGVRSQAAVPDAFNDWLYCAWVQPPMPAFTSVLATQQWLNQWFYLGMNAQALEEDGVAGKNYVFALGQYQKSVGQWRLKAWPITTDPGVYYLRNPLNPKLGCAVVKAGQYPNVWRLGFHQGKASHPALVQQGGPITVCLDNDRDETAEEIGQTKTGYFGINCHHASETLVSQVVGKWSAGCQVFPRLSYHQQLLSVCEHFRPATKNFFTYTLLHERML